MSKLFIEVDIRLQQLYLWEPVPDGDILLRQYPVSCGPRYRSTSADRA